MPELATKADLQAMKHELRASIAEFQASLDRHVQQLTIRFAIMWAVAIRNLLIIVKLT